MQSHVNDTGAEGGSAHRAGGPSVSPHNMPAEGGSKPKVQHRGSRSVDEYTRMQQIGEGSTARCGVRLLLLVVVVVLVLLPPSCGVPPPPLRSADPCGWFGSDF